MLWSTTGRPARRGGGGLTVGSEPFFGGSALSAPGPGRSLTEGFLIGDLIRTIRSVGAVPLIESRTFADFVRVMSEDERVASGTLPPIAVTRTQKSVRKFVHKVRHVEGHRVQVSLGCQSPHQIEQPLELA